MLTLTERPFLGCRSNRTASCPVVLFASGPARRLPLPLQTISTSPALRLRQGTSTKLNVILEQDGIAISYNLAQDISITLSFALGLLMTLSFFVLVFQGIGVAFDAVFRPVKKQDDWQN